MLGLPGEATLKQTKTQTKRSVFGRKLREAHSSSNPEKEPPPDRHRVYH